MGELQWTPDQIGRLTLTQAQCLVLPRPPGREAVKTAEVYAEIEQEEAEKEKAWRSS